MRFGHSKANAESCSAHGHRLSHAQCTFNDFHDPPMGTRDDTKGLRRHHWVETVLELGGE